MDQKIGVYICSGCGIGESIDVEALSGVANEFSIAKTGELIPTLQRRRGWDHQKRHTIRRRQLRGGRGLLGTGQDGRFYVRSHDHHT